MKLAPKQYQVAAEIAGNIATAWFAAGVISPFFIQPSNIFRLLISLVGSLLFTITFTTIALVLAGEASND